jgi:hypothetical protein
MNEGKKIRIMKIDCREGCLVQEGDTNVVRRPYQEPSTTILNMEEEMKSWLRFLIAGRFDKNSRFSAYTDASLKRDFMFGVAEERNG